MGGEALDKVREAWFLFFALARWAPPSVASAWAPVWRMQSIGPSQLRPSLQPGESAGLGFLCCPSPIPSLPCPAPLTLDGSSIWSWCRPCLLTQSFWASQLSGPAAERMELGGDGPRKEQVRGLWRAKQFQALAPECKRASGHWYEELLITGWAWWVPGNTSMRSGLGVVRRQSKIRAQEQVL